MVTTLTAKDDGLTFDVDENGWCRLELRIDGTITELGADSREVIAGRLHKALDETTPLQVVGSIQGIDVGWVSSLSERHCSIYVAHSGGHASLFFRGRNGSILGRIDLDEGDISRWSSTLKQLASRSLRPSGDAASNDEG